MPAAGKATCLLSRTSARQTFWQLLAATVYHQCVIEKRPGRGNRVGPKHTAGSIRRMCRENLGSCGDGDTL